LSNRSTEEIRIYLHESNQLVEEKVDILIFFKYFDSQSIKLLGSFLVSSETKLRELFEVLSQWIQPMDPINERWLIFEEISNDKYEKHSNLDLTLKESELQSGDILIFQKDFSEVNEVYFKTVENFKYYMNNRILFQFYNTHNENFEMELFKNYDYDSVMEILSTKINQPKNYLRLFTFDMFDKFI
jgi:hypothetical protein